MNSPDPVTSPAPPAAMAWYRSPIIVSLLVSCLMHALAHYNLASYFTTDQATEIVNDALNIVAVAAAANIFRARLTQKAAPTITLNKAKADSLNQASPDAPNSDQPK